jgi:hypothetical protein
MDSEEEVNSWGKGKGMQVDEFGDLDGGGQQSSDQEMHGYGEEQGEDDVSMSMLNEEYSAGNVHAPRSESPLSLLSSEEEEGLDDRAEEPRARQDGVWKGDGGGEGGPLENASSSVNSAPSHERLVFQAHPLEREDGGEEREVTPIQNTRKSSTNSRHAQITTVIKRRSGRVKKGREEAIDIKHQSRKRKRADVSEDAGRELAPFSPGDGSSISRAIDIDSLFVRAAFSSRMSSLMAAVGGDNGDLGPPQATESE